MFDVFRSPAAADRLAAAGAFVERLPPATELLVIGTSRDAADDLARRLTAARGATLGLQRASLLQLAVHCAADEMARRAVAPATGLGGEALAARVSFEAAREQALPYFMLEGTRFVKDVVPMLDEPKLAALRQVAIGLGLIVLTVYVRRLGARRRRPVAAAS